MSSTQAIDRLYLLDEEIGLLEQQAVPWTVSLGLKTERNTLLPISSLPDEILSHIFLCHVASHNVFERLPGCVPPIVPITHVCSHWRTVALSSPIFWATLDLWSPRWTKELLERSKSAELCVTANAGTDLDNRITNCFRMCLVHMNRIKRLNISLQFDHPLFLLDKPAPVLQYLQISVPINKTQPVAWLPQDLLGGSAPKLRNLTVETHFLPWTSSLLSESITHLSLQSTDDPGYDYLKQGFELSAFLDAMEHMPRITDLRLKGHMVPPVSSDPRTIALSNLKNIAIGAPFTRIISLLKHVQVPATATIGLTTLNCSKREVDVHKFVELIPLIRRRYGAPACVLSTYLVFTPRKFELEVTVENDPTDASTRHYIYLSPTGFDMFTCQDAAKLLLKNMNLAKLGRLDLHCSFSPYVWLELFGKLSSLHEITCSGSIGGLVDSLNLISIDDHSPSKYTSSGPSLQVPYGSLRRLSLGSLQDPSDRSNTIYALQHRAAIGKQIEILHIGCYDGLSYNNMSSLESSVGRLDIRG